VFSQEETSQWHTIPPPLQGTAADNEFLFLFHAANLSKAGYAVIPEVIREDTFLSHTKVDELFYFSLKSFASSGRKCRSSAQEPAFGVIFNSIEGTEEPEGTPKRCQSNRRPYHQHLDNIPTIYVSTPITNCDH
jgi:hypothetical protein